MTKYFRQPRPAGILYSVIVVLFLLFLLYVGASEGTTVYRADQAREYGPITDVQAGVVPDDTAPAGIRKIYQWPLTSEHTNGNSILFNIAYHEIEVYFGDLLVYSFTVSEGNRIGGNVGDHWCFVNPGPECTGQTATVVLTPLFENAMSKEPEFLFGSHSAFITDVVAGELPLILLSALCVFLGVILLFVSAYFRFGQNVETTDITYLGLFSVSLGLWKITDLYSAALLFPEHSMVIGYICICSLLLCGLDLMMYFSTFFEKQMDRLLLLLSFVGSLVCLHVLAMQVFGVAEIRQNLIYSHILLIAAIVSLPLAAGINRLMHKKTGLRHSWRPLLLLFVGIGLDLTRYYINNGNGLLSFSILSFIVYALIVFLKRIQESTHKAYTDSWTGLENRARWNELMDSGTPLPEPYAIVNIDLNGLKRVNDTLGHAAGDRMIYTLSSILRSTLPRSSVICRWGGDEFAVLLPNIDRIQLDQQIQRLWSAADSYNKENPELPVHFALGAALSAEHPGLSRTELFHLADEEMYRNKQHWYTEKNLMK